MTLFATLLFLSCSEPDTCHQASPAKTASRRRNETVDYLLRTRKPLLDKSHTRYSSTRDSLYQFCRTCQAAVYCECSGLTRAPECPATRRSIWRSVPLLILRTQSIQRMSLTLIFWTTGRFASSLSGAASGVGTAI